MKSKQKGTIWSKFNGLLALSLLIYGMQPGFVFASYIEQTQKQAPQNFQTEQAVAQQSVELQSAVHQTNSGIQPDLQKTFTAEQTAQNLAQQTFKLDPNLEAGSLVIKFNPVAPVAVQQKLEVAALQNAQNKIIFAQNNSISAFNFNGAENQPVQPFTLSANASAIKFSKLLLAVAFVALAFVYIRSKFEQANLIRFEVLRC